MAEEQTIKSMSYSSEAASALVDNINSCINEITTSHDGAMDAWDSIVDACFTGGGVGESLKTSLKAVSFDVDVKAICAEIRKICESIVNIDSSWRDSTEQIKTAVDNYVAKTTGTEN